MGGHIWRYELEPLDDGAKTSVTETFDWGPALAGFLYPAMGLVSTNSSAVDSTPDRMVDHHASGGQAEEEPHA